MASVKCPECGERVKLRDDVAKLRCLECGAKFRAPDEDDDERDEEVRPRSRKKQPAKKSSGVKIAAIIGGIFLSLALVGLVVVLVVRGRGKDGDAAIDASKVTADNFQRVKPGMDLAEVEKIMGGSRSSSENDMRDAFRQSLGEIEAAMETGWSRFGEGTEWRRWEGKNFRAWVAFGQTKEGKRAAFSTALEQNGSTYKRREGFMTWAAGDFGDNLDELNSQRKKEDAVRNDPKWVRGAQAQNLVAGDWRNDNGDGWLLAADGTLTEDNAFTMPMDKKKPTYRVLDDKKLTTTHPPLFTPPSPQPGQPASPFKFDPVTRTYEYFVNQDEMTIIEVTPHAHIASISFRTYYRMPPRPGSAGETKLIAPLVADIKGNDAGKRSLAFWKLKRFGKGAASALPALRELAKNGRDAQTRSEAESLVRDIEGKKP